jgi:hypothetical protein
MRTNAKVYVMRAEDGSLKVGHSIAPSKRARDIGRHVQVVHETDVLEHAERIERVAHRVLALQGKRIRGEWFNAELAEAIAAIEDAVRQVEQGRAHSAKIALTIKCDAALLERLNTFLLSAEPPMTRNAFIETAVRAFLDKRGSAQ